MTDRKNPVRTLDQRMLSLVDPVGRLLTDGFHILALFAIGAAHRLGRRRGVLRHGPEGRRLDRGFAASVHLSRDRLDGRDLFSHQSHAGAVLL